MLCESLQNVFPQQQEDNMTGKSSCAITVKGFFYSLLAPERSDSEMKGRKKMSRTISRIAISALKLNMHNTGAS